VVNLAVVFEDNHRYV